MTETAAPSGTENVQDGAGTVTVGNGVFHGVYSYGSRFGEDEGTNPEQLIAAVHAACFTMALSSILSAAGHAPESLRANARVQLRNIDGAPTLARIDLDVEGQVANVDQQQFQATQRRPSGSARCHVRWPASPRLP